MDANKMAFFAINHLESNNAQVRFAAYKVLLALYSQIKGKLFPLMNKTRQNQIEILQYAA